MSSSISFCNSITTAFVLCANFYIDLHFFFFDFIFCVTYSNGHLMCDVSFSSHQNFCITYLMSFTSCPFFLFFNFVDNGHPTSCIHTDLRVSPVSWSVLFYLFYYRVLPGLNWFWVSKFFGSLEVTSFIWVQSLVVYVWLLMFIICLFKNSSVPFFLRNTSHLVSIPIVVWNTSFNTFGIILPSSKKFLTFFGYGQLDPKK